MTKHTDEGAIFLASPSRVLIDHPLGKVAFDGHYFAPLRFDSTWDLEGILNLCKVPRTRTQIHDIGVSEEALEILLETGLMRRMGDSRPSYDQDRANDDITCDERKPVGLIFLLEQGCNLGCTYCLNGKESYAVKQMPALSVELAVRKLDEYLEFYGSDVPLSVSFFGGEPLLGWRRLISIMEEATSRFSNVRFDVTTNLTLLPDPLISASKRFGLRFTANIDGPAAVHNELRPYLGGRGSFESIARNVQKLTNIGVSVSLRIILTKQNQNLLTETLNIHRSLGAARSVITTLRGVNSDAEDLPQDLYPDPTIVWNEMTRLLEDREAARQLDFYPAIDIRENLDSGNRLKQYCGANTARSSVIDHNGNTYSCVWFVGNKEYEFGRSLENTNFHTPSEEDFIRATAIRDVDACSRCAYRELCGGPCPATRIITGDEDKHNLERQINCAITKPIVNHFMRMATM